MVYFFFQASDTLSRKTNCLDILNNKAEVIALSQSQALPVLQCCTFNWDTICVCYSVVLLAAYMYMYESY